ncbi:MAG TPA: DUF416 family protein [Candidatus Eisenbacteria bacterium]|nr:DUF416 family protein [Candidatus Eisenbacteria bacterium]
MANPELKNIDEYEIFLTETMTPWPPERRMALAAAIAEHWLPAYESFSAAEDWGDPASLRQSLDAVWSRVQGRVLTESDIARHSQQLEEITPHMDDFDAEEALIACAALSDALRSCAAPENTIPYVTRVALGVFEGLISEWPVDTGAQVRVWRKSVVRKELQTQLRLVEEIDSLKSFDAESIKALRGRIGALKVKTRARLKPKAPAALTNQTLFEQYRRMVESDLKGQVKFQAEPTPHPYLFALTYMGYWMARYSRRLQTINGSYGRFADEQGQRALLARNRARDLEETDRLDWDAKVRETLEMCLKNNSQLKVLDAASVETPHAYGPSLRRLWLEGRRLGQSDLDGWKYVRAWAGHRPSAWEDEDRRKKKGSSHQVSGLIDNLRRELSWSSTSDPFHPWATEVDGAIWRVRINDFPDELMYSLIIGNENAGDFHDWPETWQRASDSAIKT